MPVETATEFVASPFASVIQDHLELKKQNAELDGNMPLDHYQIEDPFENHPLFKSEEQARIEETLDGEPAVELHSLALPWPGEDTAETVVPEGPALDGDLWGRSRDFDWGEKPAHTRNAAGQPGGQLHARLLMDAGRPAENL